MKLSSRANFIGGTRWAILYGEELLVKFLEGKVVEPDEKISNSLTDVFKDWNYQLSRSDLSGIDFDEEDE